MSESLIIVILLCVFFVVITVKNIYKKRIENQIGWVNYFNESGGYQKKAYAWWSRDKKLIFHNNKKSNDHNCRLVNFEMDAEKVIRFKLNPWFDEEGREEKEFFCGIYPDGTKVFCDTMTHVFYGDGSVNSIEYPQPKFKVLEKNSDPKKLTEENHHVTTWLYLRSRHQMISKNTNDYIDWISYRFEKNKKLTSFEYEIYYSETGKRFAVKSNDQLQTINVYNKNSNNDFKFKFHTETSQAEIFNSEHTIIIGKNGVLSGFYAKKSVTFDLKIDKFSESIDAAELTLVKNGEICFQSEKIKDCVLKTRCGIEVLRFSDGEENVMAGHIIVTADGSEFYVFWDNINDDEVVLSDGSWFELMNNKDWGHGRLGCWESFGADEKPELDPVFEQIFKADFSEFNEIDLIKKDIKNFFSWAVSKLN